MEKKGLVVVKIGGSTLGSGDTSLEDIVGLHQEGVPLVVVHGGGKVITEWMERTGAQPRFIRGLRVTDPSTLAVVVAVLAGLVNKHLVADLLARGARALGFSGADGGILVARRRSPELGLVGEIVRVDPSPLHLALREGYLPVVAPVAVSADPDLPPGTLLNINGDTAAGEVARALEARHLVFLTDVEGVWDGSRRLIPRLPVPLARALLSSGIVAGGMVPKVEACLRALPAVPFTHIVDGRRPHTLRACLEGKEVGTRLG